MEPLEQIRIQKLKGIQDLGYDPYPTFYRNTHTLADVVKQYAEKSHDDLEQTKEKVRVAGRILTNRPFGKAGFITLSDGEGQLQAYAKKDQLPERDFQLYKLLATEMPFLAKCYLPLPEKWHGLKDVEIRYRQRYVDLVVNREVRDVFVK